MRIKLFVKDNKICYSTGKGKWTALPRGSGDLTYQLSPAETILVVKHGWIYAGQIEGRDMSGIGGLKTITEVMKHGKAK